MRINSILVPIIYRISKQFYNGTVTFSEAKEVLANNNMNSSSAGDYLYNFRYLMEGQKMTRAMNAFSMEYFLDNIFKDYGYARLSNALVSLESHIEYYENLRGTTMKKLRTIYARYSAIVPIESLDEKEQIEIIKEIQSQKKSKEDILKELRNLEETDAEIIIISGKSYKRNNGIVAQIKILKDYKFQICNTSILKKDGTFYVEAAHVTRKSQKGRETLDNIILLCPNHHKEFDLGNRVEISRTKDYFQFTLNGCEHTLKFEPNI
jgi:5-methylcytosine-specific restriction enzyme A